MSALDEHLAAMAAASGKKAAAAEEDDLDAEEVEREAALAELELQWLRTGEALGLLERELEMLQHAARSALPPPGSALAAPPEATARLDRAPPSQRAHGGPRPWLGADGRVHGTFHLTSARATAARRVFGPGHNLPTMSVEEYLELEAARGNMLSGGGPASEGRGRLEPGEEEDALARDEVAEALALAKARAWDDYKDENPRGWGNRARRS